MYTWVEALQQTLYDEIPITQQLRVVVGDYDGACLTLQAPLAENINHKGTIFAGSLNAVATLAGWSMVWLILKEADLTAKVIIQDSNINYTLPVTRNFTVSCLRPDAAQLTKFVASLQRRGKARIELATHIDEDGQRAVSFRGRYVAINDDHGALHGNGHVE